MQAPVQLAISTPSLVSMVRIAPSTLNSWVRSGLCSPSVVPGEGKRATRYWSVRDTVVVRVIKTLRDFGCPLQKIRAMCEYLASNWHEDLAGAMLLWDGKDVTYVDPGSGSLVSMMKFPGQGAFTEAVLLAAVPLDVWARECSHLAEPVDIQALRTARDERRSRRAA